MARSPSHPSLMFFSFDPGSDNNIIISWILNSVSKEISASVMYSESAYDMWKDLQERFQQTNGPRIFKLRRELVNLSQGTNSISVYFTKLNTLWDELSNFCPTCTYGKCTCGGVTSLNTFYQNEYVIAFLLGLHESFTRQLLLSDPLPPINKVFSLVSQEERQRTVAFPSGSSLDPSMNAAFAINTSSSSNTVSHHESNGKSKIQRKELPYFTKCQINGHTVETCYKIHGYPPRYKTKAKPHTNNNSTVNVNQVSSHSTSTSMVPLRISFILYQRIKSLS